MDPIDPRSPGEADEDLDAVREALESLRAELQGRLREGTRAVPGLPRVDWMRLLDELRRRVSSFGMDERSGEVDEFGFDEVALRRARPVLDVLFDRYWRVDVHGIESLPEDRPLLFVANRSGLLPWDGLMIAHAVARWHSQGARPRFMVADWLVTLPFAQPTLARLGGVRACRENAERLLRTGRSVIAFPEGAKGAAKVFRERYRVQRFGRGGVIRTALRTGAALVPVSVVGAEEVHPILFKVEGLARAVGLPFVPVTPTFPALGPLGAVPLPSKWVLRFGDPLEMDPVGPEAIEDELLVSRMTEELRTTIQRLVDSALRARASIWG